MAAGDEVEVITICGALDPQARGRAEAIMAGWSPDAHPAVVLHCPDVMALDAAALAWLWQTRNWWQRTGRRGAVACPDPRVRQLLRLTGYTAALPVTDTVEAAVTGLS